jgi:hypothetical protein
MMLRIFGEGPSTRTAAVVTPLASSSDFAATGPGELNVTCVCMAVQEVSQGKESMKKKKELGGYQYFS